MATYRFELNDKPSRNGKYAIFLRVTVNGVRKKLKTNLEVSRKSDWNPTPKGDNWIRPSEPNSKIWNVVLSKTIEKAKETYQALANEGQVTSGKIVSGMNMEAETFSFIFYAEEYAKCTYEAGEYRTYTKYITLLNKLKFFINGIKPDKILSIPRSGKELDEYLKKLKKDLLFNEITLSFLNKFKAYLRKVPNSKNPDLTLHQNTISKQFDNFKSLYNKGRIELREKGLSLKNNPFDDFECETIDTNKEKLTIEEIESLKALKLEEGSLIWHTRNCFLLAFYCAGMRAGDLIQLRGTNIVYDGGWRISYRMDKTDTIKEILLLPESLEIITRYVDLEKRTTDYVFPLLDNGTNYAKAITWEDKERLPHEVKKHLLQQVNSKNSLLNKYLGKLAEMAGITKKVSMHIARHSFANIARQKNANVYDISKALGHSSLKITESYLSKFDTQSQDETMKQVFDANNIDEELLVKQLQRLPPGKLKDILKKTMK
jgi:transposase